MPRRPNIGRVSTLDGDPMSLHRPGWRVPARDTCDPLPRHVVTDADRQAVIDSRQNYLDELASAWKHPRGLRDDDPITSAGAPNMKASGNDAMPVDDIESRISALCRGIFIGGASRPTGASISAAPRTKLEICAYRPALVLARARIR
jgi:hypothetical protein